MPTTKTEFAYFDGKFRIQTTYLQPNTRPLHGNVEPIVVVSAGNVRIGDMRITNAMLDEITRERVKLAKSGKSKAIVQCGLGEVEPE